MSSSSEYLFLDKKVKPDENTVEKKLDKTYRYWQNILSYLESSDIKVSEEWKFYSSKTGWTRKIIAGKRNLFFFTPRNNGFRVSFVFGDKAVEEINLQDISKEIKDEINKARRYMEGRGIAVEVKNKKDLQTLLQLLGIKLKI